MTGTSIEHPIGTVEFTAEELADLADHAEPDPSSRTQAGLEVGMTFASRVPSGIRLWRARGDLFVRFPDGTQEQWRYTTKLNDPVMMRRVGRRK